MSEKEGLGWWRIDQWEIALRKASGTMAEFWIATIHDLSIYLSTASGGTMSRIETFTRLLARRKLPLRHLSGVRAKSHAAHAFARDASGDAGPSTPSPRSLFSDVPLNLGRSGKGKERERVSYRPETAGVSTEQRAYFAGEDEGGLPGWGDGTDEASLAGLEPGRVVECRR